MVSGGGDFYQDVPNTEEYVEEDTGNRRNSSGIGSFNKNRPSGIYQYAQPDAQNNLGSVAENQYDDALSSNSDDHEDRAASFKDLNKIEIPAKIDHIDENDISGFEDLGRQDE